MGVVPLLMGYLSIRSFLLDTELLQGRMTSQKKQDGISSLGFRAKTGDIRCYFSSLDLVLLGVLGWDKISSFRQSLNDLHIYVQSEARI